MNPGTPTGMKGVHWMPPSIEAADLVFDTVDDENISLKAEIENLKDLHRHEQDRLWIRIDELRQQFNEWHSIALDLYLGCICQLGPVEDDHDCNYEKARAAVRAHWIRENARGQA